MGLEHAFVLHFDELIYVMCARMVWNICMMNCIWNNMVEKHNLRGSKNRMNMRIRNLTEMNKMSGWQLAPLRKRG